MEPTGCYYFSVGRGRGLPTFSPSGSPGLMGDDTVRNRISFSTPVRQELSPQASTRSDTPTVLTSEQVRDISFNISQAVSANILHTMHSGSPSLSTGHSPGGGSFIDGSQLNLVLKSQKKEPPFFRGDNSDKFSLSEWEGLMRAYLGRSGYTGRECVDELVGRLVGRARDVVRIWLRSNSHVFDSGDVEAVFGVLRQHFDSVVRSGMPLADFYATLPYPSEQPLDYWIRLNKAAEVVEQSMGKGSKALQPQTVEVAAMFIRHCPEKDLSLMFLSKPQTMWTACEVQSQLDEFLRSRAGKVGHVSQHTTLTATPVSGAVVSSVPTGESTVGVGKLGSAAAEGTKIDRLLDVLEKMVVCNAQVAGQPRQSVTRNFRCGVCQSSDHSTQSHCRLHNLCFLCFSPGHTRLQCQGRSLGRSRAVVPVAVEPAQTLKPFQGN